VDTVLFLFHHSLSDFNGILPSFYAIFGRKSWCRKATKQREDSGLDFFQKQSNPKCPLVFAFVIPDFFRQIGLGLLWLDSVYLSFARQLQKVVITRWTKQHRPQLHQIIEPPFD